MVIVLDQWLQVGCSSGKLGLHDVCEVSCCWLLMRVKNAIGDTVWDGVGFSWIKIESTFF